MPFEKCEQPVMTYGSNTWIVCDCAQDPRSVNEGICWEIIYFLRKDFVILQTQVRLLTTNNKSVTIMYRKIHCG